MKKTDKRPADMEPVETAAGRVGSKKALRFTALVMVLVLVMSAISGCKAIQPRFGDYDVSGYIKALLDSSYKGDHSAYMLVAQSAADQAEENHQLTIENGAIHFCNAFGIYPSEDQMKEIEAFIGKAYSLAEYKVYDEVKNAQGYTVEIEITPLTVFRDLTASFEKAKTDVDNGDLKGSSSSEKNESSMDESGDSYDEDMSGSSEESEASESSGEPINLESVFIDEVIRLCNEALTRSPSYDPRISIEMMIIQDGDGNLSLDSTQIEEIDITVVLFSREAA